MPLSASLYLFVYLLLFIYSFICFSLLIPLSAYCYCEGPPIRITLRWSRPGKEQSATGLEISGTFSRHKPLRCRLQCKLGWKVTRSSSGVTKTEGNLGVFRERKSPSKKFENKSNFQQAPFSKSVTLRPTWIHSCTCKSRMLDLPDLIIPSPVHNYVFITGCLYCYTVFLHQLISYRIN